MIGLIVTGHGNFATGITSSFRLIAGESPDYEAVDFLPEDSIEMLTEKLKNAAARLAGCDSILILTDLAGGSPYNVASKLRMERMDTMEVIAGLNLAGLIEAGMGREAASSARELAAMVEETAKEQVIRFLTDEEQAAAAAAKPAKRTAVRRNNPDGPKGRIVHARVDERLKENAYPGDRIFVITKNIGDMAELIRQGVEIDRVNVGNAAKREGSQNIKKSVNLTEKDIAEIHEMIDSGHSVTAQMIPNESDQSILNYLQ